MGRDALTGSRIRERRVMAGQKQSDLARQAGISASYLNLIEHNRRRIGGKLLLDIAAALGVEPQSLTEGAEAALVAALREAAEEAGLSPQDAARADEFAGRFPGWADALAGTRKRIGVLEQTIEALSDRLAHDPHLAASMHELLSTTAAIRATAAILVENKALEPEWRNRFHANIDEDSRRLSASTQALIRYLDTEVRQSGPARSNAPQEEVEDFLTRQQFYFPALETGGQDIDAALDAASDPLTPAARHIAKGVLMQIARDARLLDLARLRAAIAQAGKDPAEVSQHLDVPMAVVLRRMAALPELGAGLVVCDRAGTVLFRKSVEGFSVPRHAGCCPLWPLFAVLGHPGMVVHQRLQQVGRGTAPFDAFATAEALPATGYNAAPLTQGILLLMPAAEGSAVADAVGATCRTCPQAQCAARREPSILAAAPD